MIKVFLWGAILIVPVVMFWLMPQWDNSKIAQQKQQNLSIQYESSQLKKAELEKHQDKLYTSDDSSLTAIPVDMKQEQILRILEAVQSKSGFTFTNLIFSRGINSDTQIAEMNIQASANGPQDNVAQLLFLLESSKRFIAIRSFSLGKKDNDDQSINVQLDMLALYQGEK